jgi:hypothetical protein
MQSRLPIRIGFNSRAQQSPRTAQNAQPKYVAAESLRVEQKQLSY